MLETITCAGCGATHTYKRWTTPKKYCGKRCRETTWLVKNRDRHNATVRRYRARRYLKDGEWRESSPKASALRAWMLELKSKPCTDCGQVFAACCMDFDHRKGTRKTYNVGCMFAHHYSRSLIEKELEKCELVCANCHRVRTRDRRKGSRITHYGLLSISKNSAPVS